MINEENEEGAGEKKEEEEEEENEKKRRTKKKEEVKKMMKKLTFILAVHCPQGRFRPTSSSSVTFPCAADYHGDLVAKASVSILRGPVFKPRTSHNSH